MDEIIYPGIVSCLGLLVYYFTLYQSGMARGKFDVQAPSHSFCKVLTAAVCRLSEQLPFSQEAPQEKTE